MQMPDVAVSQSPNTVTEQLVMAVDLPSATPKPGQVFQGLNAAPSGSSSFLSGLVGDKYVHNVGEQGFGD
jgi:hypothetical protein